MECAIRRPRLRGKRSGVETRPMMDHHSARRGEWRDRGGPGRPVMISLFVSMRGVMNMKLREQYDWRTIGGARSRESYLTLAAPLPSQADWTPKTAPARRTSSVADEAPGGLARHQCKSTVQPFASCI